LTKSLRITGPIGFVLSLGLYLATLAPTVTFVDSGELILAANNLGIAHPPGFPLYVILAHLATLVPIGSIAQRVNFASALFGALAVTLLMLLVIEMAPREEAPDAPQKTKGKKRSREKLETTVASQPHSVIGFLPAVVAASLFCFSRTLWSF